MSTKRLSIALVVFGLFSGPIAAEEAYHVVKVWPEMPIGWHFYGPRAVATDKAGNVYVCDAGNYLIKKFDSKGRLLLQWGSPGEGDGQFGSPWSVKLDSSGSVLVVDPKNKRIQKFTPQGQFVAMLERKAPGVEKFETPIDVAVGPWGNVFVIAWGKANGTESQDPVRVEKYSPKGEFIAQWGKVGTGDGQFVHPLGIAVDALGKVYIADGWNQCIQKFTSDGKLLLKWGSWGEGDGHFRSPLSIALDKVGDVYVLDRSSVQKFTSEGKFLARWTIDLTARQITVDVQGNVYVPDLRGKVAKFDSNWHLVEEWGIAGGEGQFMEPQGIAVDGSGNVYVTETQRNRVQKFDSRGKFLSSWSYPPGVGGTNFWDAIARAMTTDASGDVYVLAYSVQKFSANGKLLAKWGEEGKGDGQFHGADSIATDGFGNIYVADTLNHRVQKLTPQGKVVANWGTEGTGDGQFKQPKCVTVDQSGNILVADKINDTLNRIQEFDSQGKFITKWTVPCQIMAIDIFGNSYGPLRGAPATTIAKYNRDGNRVTGWGNWDSDDSKLGGIGGIFVDATECVYVADETNNCITKFNSTGEFVRAWPIAKPDLEGSFYSSHLAKITVDSSGNMYVAEDSYTWIRKVTPDGKVAAKFQMEPPAAEGEFFAPRGVAVDSRGCVYIADLYPNNWRVQKFSPAGAFIRQWAEREEVQLPAFYDYRNEPPSVAVDDKGNTYIAVMEGKDHFICVSDANGRSIKRWGSKGIGDGQFDSPEGIAVDKSGNVYVCDRQNCRIQKFDSDGRFLAKWGKEGSDDGEFHFPAAVAIDKEGNVYVADTDNHRIQKFTAEGKFLTEWGEFGEASGQLNVPLGIAVDASGNVFVSDSHNHRIQKFAPVRSR
ncbi:MAG: NHL repeat-containing protein [Planctomycetota bacterium]|jgi:DNA-binding beta-propeller fold protein YncE